MEKKLLISFIKKYYLDGKIEDSVWSSNNGRIRTRLISEDKGVVGEVNLIKGIASNEFDCDEIAIKGTDKLLKMLNVVTDDISISLHPDSKKPKSLKFTDGTTEAFFPLADVSIIPKIPTIKNVPDEFEVSIKLNSDTKTRLMKTISALPECVSFTLVMKKNSVMFVFGDSSVNMPLVKFPVEFNRSADIGKLDFSVALLKSVLSANEESQSEPEMLVSQDGLIKLEFKNDTTETLYYLVAKAETDD